MALQETNWGPIRLIPGENNGKYPSCHSIFIENAGVLIDPASNRDKLRQLKESGKVRMVWLSHWHEDHFRDLDLFDDLPLWMSELDAPPLSDLDIFFSWCGLDDEKGAALRAVWEPVMKNQFHFRSRMPEKFLSEGDVIDLGGITVEVIHIPGHTPGHLAFYFRETEVLFMADCDLTPFGPWYGDRYSSIEKTIGSIEKLRNIPAKVHLTAHETGILKNPSGQVWDDYLDVIQRREDALLECLAEPKAITDIVEEWIIYGKERKPRELYAFGEQAHMVKHLERLIRNKKVQYEFEKYHRVR